MAKNLQDLDRVANPARWSPRYAMMGSMAIYFRSPILLAAVPPTDGRGEGGRLIDGARDPTVRIA
jgi:hypothetical protein